MNNISEQPSIDYKYRIILFILSIPALYVSITPIIYIFFWAIYGTKTPGILSESTFQWFMIIWTQQEWLYSICLSIFVCLFATSISLLLVIIFGYYSKLSELKYEQLISWMILPALLFPTVVYAIALQYFIGTIRIPEIVGLILAHAALIMPIQYLIIKAAHGRLPRSQLWAAATMGASPKESIIRIYIPAMFDALLVSWLIGAFVSFDEVVIPIFIWNYVTSPVSKNLWNLFGRSSEPIPAAIAVCTILLIIFISMGYLYLLFKKKRLKQYEI